MAALLNAERLLKRGEVLGMFPEGTRSRGGGMGKPHPGTALIALRAGAPVLPTRSFSQTSPTQRPRFTITTAAVAGRLSRSTRA